MKEECWTVFRVKGKGKGKRTVFFFFFLNMNEHTKQPLIKYAQKVKIRGN